jgi:uncharacterized protein YkwD
MRRGLARPGTALGLTLALSMVLAAVAPAAHAAWTPRRDMLKWVNSARSNHGAVRLEAGWRLRAMADDHSRQMAKDGRIYHTTSLGSKLTFVSWKVAGENVGAGGSMRALFKAFMRSDVHRANILGRGYRRIGVGVYARDGFLWVTTIFVG